MHKKTVDSGLKLITTGIVIIILATFYHEQIAAALSLTPNSEVRLVFLGFFWGGLFSGLGVIISVMGFLRSQVGPISVKIGRTLVILLIATVFFFYLLFSSFTSEAPPKLRPGETITI